MSSSSPQKTNKPSQNPGQQQQQQQPGLVAGHAEYIKGAAEVSTMDHRALENRLRDRKQRWIRDSRGQHAEIFFPCPTSKSAIGGLTGSNAWVKSGEQDKAHAQASLKAATENRDPAKAGYGKVEEMAGKVTGCEGMRQEGAISAAKRSD